MEQHLIVYITYLTDGGRRGIHEGLAAKLLCKIPHLLSIHYVAHREALVVTDASKNFLEFHCIDKLTNKIYSWLGKSAKRNGEIKGLMELFKIDKL
eukprot:Gb_19382 [translate_table: standard]